MVDDNNEEETIPVVEGEEPEPEPEPIDYGEGKLGTDIIHTPSGDISRAEYETLRDPVTGTILSSDVKASVKAREEAGEELPDQPPPPDVEEYEQVTEGGETYFVKDGVYYKQFGTPGLVQVLEPSRARTERLYGVEGTERDITPESVTTEGMRPDEILIAMRDAGADAATLMAYMNEHPDSRRGAAAGQLVQGLQAQLTELSEQTGQTRIETATALGVLPEGFDELPQELKDAYGVSDEAYNTAVKAYNEDIEAQQQAQYEAAHALDVVRNPDGSYDLRKAFEMGLGDRVYDARAAGLFTPEQIVQAQLGGIREEELARRETKARDEALDALSDYKTDKGYDLSSAFAEGKGKLVYDAQAVGLFTPDQVAESQFASIEARSAELALQARAAEFEGLGLADYKVSAFSEARLKEEMTELGSLYSVSEIRAKRDEIAAGVGGDVTGYDLAKYFKDYGTDLETIKQIEKDLVAVGFDAKQVQLARVGAFTAPSTISPITKEEFEKGRPGWAGETAMALQGWLTDLTESMSELPTDNRLANLALTAGGAAIVTGAALLTAVPTLLLRTIDKPLEAPGMLGAVVVGLGAHVVNTAKNIWEVDEEGLSKYARDYREGNLFPLVRDTTISYLVISGGIRLAKGVVSKVTTYLRPRGVPASVIAKEVSTGRIKVSQEQFAKAYADAINKVEKLAMTKGGKFSGTVPIKGTPFELHYLKTPLQQKVGNVLFHGTKDVIDAKGNLITSSSLRLAEMRGGLVVPKGGLYTSPWAAVAYTRSGQNPGLLMIITNSAKFKSGAGGLTRGITPSDSFVRGAPRGFYGSSKTWRGDLETEIVFGPGTKLLAPLPTMTGLLNRMTVGRYADFFTYDAGKYIPIKIAVDTAALGKGAFNAMTPANLYAVKLYSLYGGLRDAAVSLKHPILALKDVSGTMRELFNLNNWVREGGRGGLTMPGLRDVYVVTNYGSKIKSIAISLWNEAFRRTKAQLGDKVSIDSAAFRSALERNMSSVYSANASSLISAFKDVAVAYTASEVVRSKFEASYIANLGMSVEALAKSSYLAESSIESSLIDSIKSYPISELQRAQLISSLQSASEASVISTGSTLSSMRIEEERPISDIVSERPVSEVSERPISEVRERPVERTIREVRERPIERAVSELREPIREPREPITREPIREPIREPREPIRERPIEVPREPIITPIILPKPKEISPLPQPIEAGSICWRQGLFWKYIPPPWDMDKPINLKRGVIPTGAVNTDLKTPQETIQMIGQSTAVVPESISIDLGVVDAFITNKGTQIEFRGKGEETDVGERLPSTTMGMSVDGGYPGMVSSNEGINKASMRHKKPVRKKKVKRDDDFSSILSVRGVRF